MFLMELSITDCVDCESPEDIVFWPNKLPRLPTAPFKPPSALLKPWLAAFVMPAILPPVAELILFNPPLTLLKRPHQN